MDKKVLADALQSYDNFIKFKMTDQLAVLLKLKHKTVGIFSGNRGGKTASVAKTMAMRVFGIHPIADKNRLARKIRCMSSSLPESVDPDEGDNAQYIELKKLIPREMIIKDITARSQNLVVRRPPGLSSKQTVFEFRSSKQELQDLGKISLSCVWHDEETPKAIREECKPRLGEEKGDEIFTLTPTNLLSYCYDEVWQKASFIYRTKTVTNKFGLPRVEHHNTGHDIACIQMASDDNPLLDEESLGIMFDDITDPDDIALRRYGVFRQISGRVHKTYDPSICYINFNNYFPNGVPYEWVHARGIDYHESRIPWSVGWLSASPDDEWFLHQEFHPAIDGPNAYNTYEIAKAIARKSGDYEYIVNLIDPLANKKQPNTLFSTTDDLNRHFNQMRREEGVGAACFWQGWDTKGTTGRNNIMTRFKNAVRCGKPFNNTIKERGMVKKLPTLWINNQCRHFHKSILNWRFGEYVATATKAVNDPKNTPQQKWSHDNMVLECLAKNQVLQMAAHYMKHKPTQMKRRHASGR